MVVQVSLQLKWDSLESALDPFIIPYSKGEIEEMSQKEQRNPQDIARTTGTALHFPHNCLCSSAPAFLSQHLPAGLHVVSLLTEAAARFPTLHTFVQRNSAWSNLEQAKSWCNLQLRLVTPRSRRAEVAHRCTQMHTKGPYGIFAGEPRQ